MSNQFNKNSKEDITDSLGKTSKQMRKHGTLLFKAGELYPENKSVSNVEEKKVKASTMQTNQDS